MPTEYSDRLLLQMLIKNRRLPRALRLKQEIESSGRTIDTLSYGSLIDHCARQGQLGSALLLLKECVSVHGAPPNEKSLQQLRLLGRQNKLEEEITEYAGTDSLAWLRHGENKMKRELSKKGRAGINRVRNAFF